MISTSCGAPSAFTKGFYPQDVVDGLYERHLHVYSWPGGELRQTLDLSNTRLIPLEEDGVDVTTNSLHPGTIATNIFRHRDIYATGFVNMLGKFLLRSVPQVEKYAKDEDLKVV